MAAERAAPERDELTSTPLEPLCGALDGRRWLYELIELLDRIEERDDGRPEWTVSGISTRSMRRGGWMDGYLLDMRTLLFIYFISLFLIVTDRPRVELEQNIIRQFVYCSLLYIMFIHIYDSVGLLEWQYISGVNIFQNCGEKTS